MPTLPILITHVAQKPLSADIQIERFCWRLVLLLPTYNKGHRLFNGPWNVLFKFLTELCIYHIHKARFPVVEYFKYQSNWAHSSRLFPMRTEGANRGKVPNTRARWMSVTGRGGLHAVCLMSKLLRGLKSLCTIGGISGIVSMCRQRSTRLNRTSINWELWSLGNTY